MQERNPVAVPPDEGRAYRWGLWFFAIVSACGLAALPYELTCCAAFSRLEFSQRSSVAAVLLDWPLDFRVFLLALVAVLICTAGMLIPAFVSRWEQGATGSSRSCGCGDTIPNSAAEPRFFDGFR